MGLHYEKGMSAGLAGSCGCERVVDQCGEMDRKSLITIFFGGPFEMFLIKYFSKRIQRFPHGFGEWCMGTGEFC